VARLRYQTVRIGTARERNCRWIKDLRLTGAALTDKIWR